MDPPSILKDSTHHSRSSDPHSHLISQLAQACISPPTMNINPKHLLKNKMKMVGSLVGTLKSSLNFEDNLIRAAIRHLWGKTMDFEFFPLANNRFICKFKKETDKDRIMFNNPWFILGSLLILKEIGANDEADVMPLDELPLWIELKELKPEHFSWKVVRAICAQLGAVDPRTPKRGSMSGDEGMKVLVTMKVDSPLPTVTPASTAKGEITLVKVVYTGFAKKFCLFCIGFGHNIEGCSAKKLALQAIGSGIDERNNEQCAGELQTKEPQAIYIGARPHDRLPMALRVVQNTSPQQQVGQTVMPENPGQQGIGDQGNIDRTLRQSQELSTVQRSEASGGLRSTHALGPSPRQLGKRPMDLDLGGPSMLSRSVVEGTKPMDVLPSVGPDHHSLQDNSLWAGSINLGMYEQNLSLPCGPVVQTAAELTPFADTCAAMLPLSAFFAPAPHVELARIFQPDPPFALGTGIYSNDTTTSAFAASTPNFGNLFPNSNTVASNSVGELSSPQNFIHPSRMAQINSEAGNLFLELNPGYHLLNISSDPSSDRGSSVDRDLEDRLERELDPDDSRYDPIEEPDHQDQQLATHSATSVNQATPSNESRYHRRTIHTIHQTETRRIQTSSSSSGFSSGRSRTRPRRVFFSNPLHSILAYEFNLLICHARIVDHHVRFMPGTSANQELHKDGAAVPEQPSRSS